MLRMVAVSLLVCFNKAWTDKEFSKIKFDELKDMITARMRNERLCHYVISQLKKFNLIVEQQNKFGYIKGFVIHHILAVIVLRECPKIDKSKL